MQILPTSGLDSTYGFYGADSESGAAFSSAMDEALSSVANGDSYSVDAALQENPHVDSPYSRHTTDGVTYTMSEVLFTKSELAELRLALLKEGAPEESLKDFDILADQPNGATLAQVLASLMRGKSETSLTDEDSHAITALLGQIDPTGDLAAKVLAEMTQGNGAGALELIQAGLQANGGSIDINLSDALALGRGLGLNSDTLRQLAEQFNGFSSLSLDAGQFSAFLKPAQNQFMQDAANNAKLEAALDNTLRPIISKARNRMEKEKLASEREARRVQQSRTLIEKNLKENSTAMLDETVAESGSEKLLRQADMLGHAGEGKKDTLEEMTRTKASNAENALNQKTAHKGDGQILADLADKDTGAHGDAGQRKQDGWADLLSRVEAKPVATSQGPVASSFVYSMLQNEMGTSPIFNQETPGFTPQLSAQLADQVEQGILTAMGNGATRLDLQLHPAELGQMAITLVARNGELTAIIKSEKTETAEMMQREADTIRVNLEQQGIRVDKIEVQLENHQDMAQNNFGDLDRHNARQEEEARRQDFQRMRNLSALRNMDAETETLAQSVHDSGQMARYAGQALHVVA